MTRTLVEIDGDARCTLGSKIGKFVVEAFEAGKEEGALTTHPTPEFQARLEALEELLAEFRRYMGAEDSGEAWDPLALAYEKANSLSPSKPDPVREALERAREMWDPDECDPWEKAARGEDYIEALEAALSLLQDSQKDL